MHLEEEIEFVEVTYQVGSKEPRTVEYIEVPVWNDSNKEASILRVSLVDFKDWVGAKGADWRELKEDHEEMFKVVSQYIREEMIGTPSEITSGLKSKLLGHQIKEKVLFDTIERLREEIERLKSENQTFIAPSTALNARVKQA